MPASHTVDAMGIGAWIQCIRRGYWAWSIEKRRRGAPLFGLQVGHFQRVEAGILRIGDACLATKVEAEHGDAAIGVGMRSDDQGSRLGQDMVGSQHIAGGTNLRLAGLQGSQRTLSLSNRCSRERTGMSRQRRRGYGIQRWP